MCCLFGFVDYGHRLTRKQRSRLLDVLSVACEDRGTDATGIAYNHDGRQHICKRPIPAHLMWYRVPVEATVVMGHTRMTTQGSAHYWGNNHPFPGRAGKTNFALAHNGILYNDKILRKEHKLPATKIETDSYVAVQLLDKFGKMDFEGLQAMAEQLEGSFTITALSDRDELYFVKGNNPMCIYHYPEAKLYVYASTEEILKKAMLQAQLRLGKAEKVNLFSGELLRIDTRGKITRSHFDDSRLYSSFSFPWSRWEGYEAVKRPYAEDSDYLKTIKKLIENQSLSWSANHLSVTLHRLDAIIVDLTGATQNIQEYLADNPDEDEYRGKASQAINSLYHELMATRTRNSIRNKAGETTKIKFELPLSEDTPNAEIISRIKDILSSPFMEEKTRREKFFAVYREYLFARNKDNAETKNGEQFYQNYLSLKKYTGETASIDEFEREVREELKRIAYRTFAPVILEDYIPHYYIESRFSHARYAFAYTQLINAQDQIRNKVHNALRLLSATYTIIRLFQTNTELPFANGKDIEEFEKWLDLRNQSIITLLDTELASQVNMIRLEREHLQREYANVNLLRQYDQQSVQRFVQLFNDSCPELFGTGPLISETVEALATELGRTTDILRILYIQSAFLQSECMMIIREEIENTVKELKSEYERYDSIK